jgi:phosphoglycolate phosphatase
MTHLRWHTLFWDLDGTITDPRRGIIDSYIEFLTEANLTVPKESELLWVIGPPLRECMATLLNTSDKAVIEAAVVRYRYWYVQKGLMYRDTPYDGIKELLTDLRTAGYRMFVATAKAHEYARLILRHWGLEDHFEEIHGSEIDGTRGNKTDLLKWMTELYQIPADHLVLMIGDRKHDAVAAKNNNLSSVGIGYGYGSKEELIGSGVDHYCPSLMDLRALLLAL